MEIRNLAKQMYANVASTFSNVIRAKEKDISSGSFIANSLIRNNSFELWHHFFFLVNLLAFSSGMEWRRMWEEYIYIKNNLKIENYDIKNLNELLESVKKYIMALQKQYR